MQTIKESFKTIAVSFSVFFLIGIAHAWTEPATNPTSGNAVPPISIAGGQIVEGGLVLGNSTVPNGLIVKTGNVGIGVTDPKTKLSISGTTTIDTPTYIPSSSSLVANYPPVKDFGIEGYGKFLGVSGSAPFDTGYGVGGSGGKGGVYGYPVSATGFGGYFEDNPVTGAGEGLFAESLCLGTITNCKNTWPAGSVTSITAGSGLSGGTITTSGTISLNTANANIWSGVQTFGDIKANNYIQIANSTATPPTSDCDQTTEVGRMRLWQSWSAPDRLYLCINGGGGPTWAYTNLNF